MSRQRLLRLRWRSRGVAAGGLRPHRGPRITHCRTTRPVPRWYTVRGGLLCGGVLVWGLVAMACLGTLTDDAIAQAVTLAPRGSLDLPLRDNKIHWLLRGQPGWCGAHEARFGGDTDDPAILTVRAVRFRDQASASRGFATLTPTYLGLVLRDRVSTVPSLVSDPLPLPGDQSTVLEYQVRAVPEMASWVDVRGQLTVLRAGRVVLVLESIGVAPEQLLSAADRLTDTASRLATSGC